MALLLHKVMAFTVFLYLLGFAALAGASPHIEGLRQPCYAIQRDLNIVFMSSHSNRIKTDSLMKCSPDPGNLRQPTDVAYPEALKYGIDQVNARQDLLPNISLGFVFTDYCSNALTGMAQSTYIVPDPEDTNFFPDGEVITCRNGYKRFKNVVGTLGPGYSRLAVMSVGLFSVFHLPSLLTFATSDELSDKSRFPYSLRLVPPDKYQADAMTDLLLHFGWTYTSILYQEGSYGENGAKLLRRKAKEKGICVAFSYMVPYDSDTFEEVVDTLLQHKTARAVLLFLAQEGMRRLGTELLRRRVIGHFVFIGSDAFGQLIGDMWKIYDGSFAVRFSTAMESDDFRAHFYSLTPKQTTNPWMPSFWEKAHNCRWNASQGERSCEDFEDIPSPIRLASNTYVDLVLDGVSVFAHAIHNVIEQNCPEVFMDKSKLHKCVKGPNVLEQLLNTSIDGYLGKLRFDEKGDFKGSYDLRQYHYSTMGSVVGAVWNRLTGSLIVHTERLRWFSQFASNSNDAIISTEPPESVCSKPCQSKQYYIQRELPCCWECRYCRENEILVGNNTGCETCELLTWPDEQFATVCEPIEPTILGWTDPLTIALTTMISIGSFGCISTGLVFAKNRQAKIIKASSYQLMAIILSGILMAYLTAFAFLLRPSPWSCMVCRVGFNLAVSLIYGPLLVKTNRIYRIFSAGKKGTKRPAFVGTRSQLVMVAVVIVVQVSGINN